MGISPEPFTSCDGPPNTCGACSVCIEGGFAAAIDNESMIEELQKLSIEFDEVCQARHEMGERKYGPGTWLKVDTLEMAIEELIDLANYTRFSYIKLRVLQKALDTNRSTAKPKLGNEMMGKNAFTSSKEGLPS